jgi:lipopolysaccharide/colanic/teichoic acid biosynthesis glycosyltransferase
MVALPLPSSPRKGLGSRQRPVRARDAATRIFDILVAAVILVFFAPLLIAVAAAVLAESGRPIFFSQVRLGRGGRHFRMYKFRKFHERRCPAGCPLTMEDDPRLSGVGRVLAWAKLDELPQLWNVLKGDMSIVGPRPESLDFQDCFEGPYRQVLEHKPGIFGPTQVLLRNERSFYRGRVDPERFYRDVLFPLKAHIDAAYFAHRTLLRDIAWAIRSVLGVFGWSSLLRAGAALVEEVEHRVKEGRAGGSDLQTRIGLLTGVRRWGVVDIAREGGGEITGAGRIGETIPALGVRRQWGTRVIAPNGSQRTAADSAMHRIAPANPEQRSPSAWPPQSRREE